MTGPRKIFVKTFGCQMNVYDFERMTELLAGDGFAETDAAEDADVIVLNTCHIREKAAEKVYSDLGRIREVKAERARAGKGTIVTVAGCVAQAEGAEILRRASAVDLVVGPQSYHRLGELVARAGAGHRIVETGFPEEDKFARLPERAGPRAVTAFLTVQEGCDKFCTFCVVPYTRGAEFSRTVADIEAEARRLADRGVREITLLGQNVNAYHGLGPDGRPWSLARLIDRLAQIDGIERIRYTTSHPHDMSDDLIAAHGRQRQADALPAPAVPGRRRPHPRGHEPQAHGGRLSGAGRAHPRGASGPGVVDGHHRRLSRRDGRRVRGHPRDGGAGRIRAGLLVQVQPAPRHAGRDHGRAKLADEVKTERLHRLQDLLARQQTSFNSNCVGRVMPVLFERAGRYPGQLVGRSPYLQAVHAEADSSLIGRVVEVAIEAVRANSLAGTVRRADQVSP